MCIPKIKAADMDANILPNPFTPFAFLNPKHADQNRSASYIAAGVALSYFFLKLDVA